MAAKLKNKEEDKSVSCIGNADKKLQILENRELTTAENRRMVELASAEDGKKICKFLKDKQRGELKMAGPNGDPLVFKKVRLPYEGCKDMTVMILEQPKRPNNDPNQKQVVVVDNETGINIPFVNLTVGVDSCARFTFGVEPEKLQLQALESSPMVYETIKDTEDFARNEKLKVAAKITNTELEKKSSFWDTWISPGGHEKSQRKAIYSARCGMLVANALQIMTNGMHHLMNIVIPHLYEIDFHVESAMGSLKSIPHVEITKDSKVKFTLKKSAVNVPLVPGIVMLRMFSIENNMDFLPNPIIYVPGTQFLKELHGAAFDYSFLFDGIINPNIPLANMKIHHEERFRDYSYVFCSGTKQNDSRTAAFMIVHIYCMQSSFEGIFQMLGNGLAQHFLDSSRLTFLNCLKPIVENGGVFEVQPYILDGTSPAAFLSILNNATVNDFTPKKEAISMEDKQKQIVESWEELKPCKVVVAETLPIGVYRQGEETVDCRKTDSSEQRYLSNNATCFDFSDCIITNEAIEHNEFQE